jgi:phosphatidate cytidylyltransferase
MKTLLTRALSAVAGVAFVTLLIVFGGANGLRFLTALAVLLAVREGMRMLFPASTGIGLRAVFALLAVGLFAYGAWDFASAASAYGIAMVLFFSLSLLSQKKFSDLDALSRFQARALLGFLYLALLPTFAFKTLDLENGSVWFLALLGFVFSSDTCAYLVGWKFGKRLLMPAVSPKKTVEGSLGGLIGSALSAVVVHLYLPHVPLFVLIALALAVGMIGQMGDLFESMLKRVAHQKDSGSLMPGHGGALDRIDGVIFAAPVLFVGASLIEKWF